MKEYLGNHEYRGRFYDFRFCAKNNKEAAMILDVSNYYVSQYVSSRKIDNPYTEYFAKPHGSTSVDLVGIEEMEVKDFQRLIDIHAEEEQKKWR